MDDALLPHTDAEQKAAIRCFLTMAFRDLMQCRPVNSPETVPTRVWFDLDLAAEAWKRRGFGMDA